MSGVTSKSATVIDLDDVHKVYGEGEAEVRALDGVDLSVRRGEFVAVMGASGSGKSTCMNIVGCLDAPTTGAYRFCGCLLYTSPSPRDQRGSRMPSSA